jgi:hypothetical protein
MKWKSILAALLILNCVFWLCYFRFFVRTFEDPLGSEFLGFLLGLYTVAVPFTAPLLGCVLIRRWQPSVLYWRLFCCGFVASVVPVVVFSAQRLSITLR